LNWHRPALNWHRPAYLGFRLDRLRGHAFKLIREVAVETDTLRVGPAVVLPTAARASEQERSGKQKGESSEQACK